MLSANTSLGRLVRLPLRLIPADAVVRVLQGRAMGMKWIAGSGMHGYWLGTWEASKRRLFERTVKPEDVIYDIGANVGYYTLSAAAAAPRGRVIAFEPLPRNLAYLRKHVEMNRLTNVEIIAAAVSDTEGTATFDDSWNHAMGRLSDKGRLAVRTVAIDAFDLPPPKVVKMDIEGGEVAALRGMKRILTEHRPTVFLATHGDEIEAKCLRLLREIGYRIETLDSREFIAY